MQVHVSVRTFEKVERIPNCCCGIVTLNGRRGEGGEREVFHWGCRVVGDGRGCCRGLGLWERVRVFGAGKDCGSG